MQFLDYDGLSRFFTGLKNIFADKNHTHQSATSYSNGFMTKDDKNKIDSIDTTKMCTYDGTYGQYNSWYKSHNGVKVNGKYYTFPTFASLVYMDGEGMTVDDKITLIESALGSSDGVIDGGKY